MTGRTAAAVVLTATIIVGALGGVVLDRSVLLPRHIGTPPRGPRTAGARGDGRGGGGRGWPGQEQAMRDRFAAELNLSADQKVRFDAVMMRELLSLRATRDQVRPQMDSIVRETRASVDSILTAAQREQLRGLRDRNFFKLPYPPGGPRGGGGAGGGDSDGFRRRPR
jgi:hypothetical protein